MQWYTGRLAPGTYDCTWQVMNNFWIVRYRAQKRERERDLFYFEIFGYLLEIKCGTWTEVQVCTSDTREEIGL